MMRLVIFKRDTILVSSILFVIFSCLFLLTQHAIFERISLINLNNSINYLKSHFYIFILAFLSIYSILNAWNKSPLLFSIFGTAVTIDFLNLILKDYDKLLILMCSLYLVWFFYFYLILKNECNEAIYNPNFSKYDMFNPLLVKYEIKLISPDNSELPATLTNWSEKGIFLKFEQNSRLIFDKYKAEINFNNEVFKVDLKLVSQLADLSGAGFKILPSKKTNVFDWYDLYTIFEDMGHSAQALR